MKAENGKVVIPALAAFENSPYASATSRYNNNDTLYYWQAVETFNGGVRALPDNGASWNTGIEYLCQYIVPEKFPSKRHER